MIKKALDETSIVNELSGNSLFFHPELPRPLPEASPKDPVNRPGMPLASPHPPAADTDTTPARATPTGLVTDQEPVSSGSGSRPAAPPAGPSPARTPVRVRRSITRYAFEFFQDQVESLKGFSIEEQIRGEKGSMSEMVREAVDAYIAKRKRTED